MKDFTDEIDKYLEPERVIQINLDQESTLASKVKLWRQIQENIENKLKVEVHQYVQKQMEEKYPSLKKCQIGEKYHLMIKMDRGTRIVMVNNYLWKMAVNKTMINENLVKLDVVNESSFNPPTICFDLNTKKCLYFTICNIISIELYRY